MQNIKRLQRDLANWKEFQPHFPKVSIAPLEDDLTVWHFNIFFDGIDAPLHGNVKFPKNYPFDPPRVFFSRDVKHDQVTGKRHELCLDLLLRTDGYYSGWSSAYSVVSIVAQLHSVIAQIQDDIENDRSSWNKFEKDWSKFTCRDCGHDGGDEVTCCPPRFDPAASDAIDSGVRRTKKRVWNLLYPDVEKAIFCFLSSTDLHKISRVSLNIQQVLDSMKLNHWNTIQCYHSHETFRDFCKALDTVEENDSIENHVFGIGFSMDHWNNTTTVVDDDEKSATVTEQKLRSISMSLDVLNFDSFAKGVTFSMWKDFEFTHFLPLFLNNDHGKVALKMCRKLISRSYKKKDSAPFEPILALQFLTKLMNTTIVHLMTEVEENSDSVSLFTSTKAMQGYMYIYHLLLGFCRKYPSIIDRAKEKVEQFMDDDQRNKTNFPDLGEFIVYLTIADVDWRQIGPLIVRESSTRGAKWILKEHPEFISTHKNKGVSCIRLRRTWESRIIGNRLLMFQVFFLKNVCGMGSDGSLDLEERLRMYNRRLGQAPIGLARDLQVRCREIFRVGDWLEYYQMIDLPCPSAVGLSTRCRLAMIESDWKGYHRFEATPVKNRQHENPGMCLCSGKIMEIADDTDDGVEEEDDDENEDEAKEHDGSATVKTSSRRKRKLDIAFSFDCTGSMAGVLDSVKRNIRQIAEKLSVENRLDVRFAIVGYRDHGGQMGGWSKVTKVTKFCSIDKFKKAVDNYMVGGGGGYEAVADAWYDIIHLNWRRFSVKTAINLADIACNGLEQYSRPCELGHDPIRLAREMLSKNITLYNIGCSLRGYQSEIFFEGTAHMTGGLCLPMGDVMELPKLIVQTTLETVSLTDILPEVMELVDMHRERNELVSRDQLAYLVHQDLKEKGVTTKKMGFVYQNVPDESQQVSECSSLSECKEIIDEWAREPDAVTDRETRRTQPHKLRKVKAKPTEITLDQTQRCITRAEQMLAKRVFQERGCTYRTEEYKKQKAMERYAAFEMKMEPETMPFPRVVLKNFDDVEVFDTKSQTWHLGTVTKIDKENYRYLVRVSLGGRRGFSLSCSLNSRRIKKTTKKASTSTSSPPKPRTSTQFARPSAPRPSPSRPRPRPAARYTPPRNNQRRARAPPMKIKKTPKGRAVRFLRKEPVVTKKINMVTLKWGGNQPQPAQQGQQQQQDGPVVLTREILERTISDGNLETLRRKLNKEEPWRAHALCVGLDDNGRNLLHSVSVKGDVRMVNLLLEFGVDPFVKDKEGMTPFDHLRKLSASGRLTDGEMRNHHTVARRLVDAMTKPETRHLREHIFDTPPPESVQDAADQANTTVTGAANSADQEVSTTSSKKKKKKKNKKKRKQAAAAAAVAAATVTATAAAEQQAQEQMQQTTPQMGMVVPGLNTDLVGLLSLSNLPVSFAEPDVIRFISEIGLVPSLDFVPTRSPLSSTTIRQDIVVEVGQNVMDTLLQVSTLSEYNVGGFQIIPNIEFKPRVVVLGMINNVVPIVVEEPNVSMATAQVPPAPPTEEEVVPPEPVMSLEETAFRSAYGGDVQVVADAVSQKKSILTMISPSGQRILHVACMAGHVDVVDCLLSLGADPMLTNRDGVIPVDMIERRKEENFAQIKRLLSRRERRERRPAASSSTSRVFANISQSDMVVKSALCVIPPQELWGPIQKIRKVYDKGYDRWMPHINVMYPYVPASSFVDHVSPLSAAFKLHKMRSFRVAFDGFDYFDRRGSGSEDQLYVYLKTRIVGGERRAWDSLMNVMKSVYPKGCKEQKFQPHLTVAQMSRSRVRAFVDELNRTPIPGVFEVNGVCLISRSGFKTPFGIDHVVQFS